MGPVVDRVETDERPPAETGIVVIGGGIIGTSTALALDPEGHRRHAMREGPHRRRAVQPQLGLGAQERP